MAKLPLVDLSLFDDLIDKEVSITVRNESTVLHKLGPIMLKGAGMQKLSTLKNAPDKRERDGKMYTPPMFTLWFDKDSCLVFIIEDTTITARYKGVCLVLDKLYVDVVQYEV
jgi:hypothetical protein